VDRWEWRSIWDLFLTAGRWHDGRDDGADGHQRHGEDHVDTLVPDSQSLIQANATKGYVFLVINADFTPAEKCAIYTFLLIGVILKSYFLEAASKILLDS
jgi:hypothetical protein